MSNDTKESLDEQLALLKKINSKMDNVSAQMQELKKENRRAGAVAGAVAGGISGGIVATGLAILRAKVGF